LTQGRTLRTEGTFVDGVIRITLNVNDFPRACPPGVNNHTAADGTVAADARRLFGEADFQCLGMGFDRPQINAQTRHCSAYRRNTRNLQKTSTRYLHRHSFLRYFVFKEELLTASIKRKFAHGRHRDCLRNQITLAKGLTWRTEKNLTTEDFSENFSQNVLLILVCVLLAEDGEGRHQIKVSCILQEFDCQKPE
jgi:hypothetical protein